MPPRKSAARRRTSADRANRVVPVEDYEHPGAHRLNNPPAGLAHLDRERTPTRTLSFDPHLDPQLQWAGKAERSEVVVPAPSIHVHEELSAQKIVGSVRRQRLQAALFDVDELDPDKAVEFYRHDLGWSNRMILGDSLVVMTSLLERERLGGQVQCVYIDPPYGVKYNSNFQPRINDRNVKDGADDSLTREPEMIQAYRDTWELGVHSYLSYLRDRLEVTRDLLDESGSVFVQISVDNAHLVRVVLDEIFGAQNHVNTITFLKTSGAGAPGELTTLPTTSDLLLWYARSKSHLKFRAPYRPKADLATYGEQYSWVELPDGGRRKMTAAERADVSSLPTGSRIFRISDLTSQTAVEASTFPVEVDGHEYRPRRGGWKTSNEGMRKLVEQRRLLPTGNTLSYIRYVDDFEASPITDFWSDTITSGFGPDKVYVVQTNPRVISRCLLMTTDPGDLVLDPTCGSGTTAVVSEQYGRRWITIDTSRVSLALARERLLTSVFPYYELRDPQRNVDGGLVYETLNRVTLRSIARGEQPENVVLVDQPRVDRKKTRVSGPFTVEALSRYAVNPLDPDPSSETSPAAATSHVEVLLDALRTQGIPRPGSKPLKIESLTEIASAGPLQAEGIFGTDRGQARFAVSLGPQFGAVTMAQVSDALRQAIGFDLVVFAGFAVSADAQDRLGTGRVGSTDVALLLANPDLLVGDLLKNTQASQTFRLYAAPDVNIERDGTWFRVNVEGVDSFDAASGEVTSVGRTGVQAWFLDDDYDNMVFRATQAFFPVTDAWQRLERALRATVDAELVDELHGWTSLPFEAGEHHQVAVRVIANDGNAAEVVLELPKAKQ